MVAQELEHMSEWAAENNLKLNSSKSVELIILRPRTRIGNCNVPPPSDGVTRLNNIKIPGVIVTDTLSFEMHISGVISKCAQTSYALRIMRAHGLNRQALWDVTRSTLVSKLMYASPVWFGFLNEDSKKRCQAVLNHMKRAGYLDEDFKSFAESKNLYPRSENSACANVTVFPIPLILAVDRVRHINYNILGLSHYSNILD